MPRRPQCAAPVARRSPVPGGPASCADTRCSPSRTRTGRARYCPPPGARPPLCPAWRRHARRRARPRAVGASRPCIVGPHSPRGVPWSAESNGRLRTGTGARVIRSLPVPRRPWRSTGRRSARHRSPAAAPRACRVPGGSAPVGVTHGGSVRGRGTAEVRPGEGSPAPSGCRGEPWAGAGRGRLRPGCAPACVGPQALWTRRTTALSPGRLHPGAGVVVGARGGVGVPCRSGVERGARPPLPGRASRARRPSPGTCPAFPGGAVRRDVDH